MEIYTYIKENTPPYWKHVIDVSDENIKHACKMIERTDTMYYPPKEKIFRAIQETPLPKVKVIIVGQDPYYGGQACGLSFSTEKGFPIQPSLKKIYEEIKSCYPDFVVPLHGDISSWCSQGVLLLNMCLTVKPNQAKSHRGIWSGFIFHVLRAVFAQNPRCIVCMWGKEAQKLADNLPETCHKLTAGHPSPLNSGRGEPFTGCKHFLKINEILEKEGKETIDWSTVNKE